MKTKNYLSEAQNFLKRNTQVKSFDIVQLAAANDANTEIEVRLGNRFTNAATPSEFVLKSNALEITVKIIHLIIINIIKAIFQSNVA